MSINCDDRRQQSQQIPDGRVISASDYARLLSAEQASATHVRGLPLLHEQIKSHGFQQGLRQAYSDLDHVLAELKRWREDQKSWLQAFVFEVLRKVLGTMDSATLVAAIAERVVEESGRNLEAISIHVHPASANAVAARFAKMNSKLAVDVVADERLAAASCELHTPFGIVDAGLDTQLDALEAALTSRRPEAQAAGVR